MGAIVQHLALGALNDPAVNARAGEAHRTSCPTVASSMNLSGTM